MPAWVLIGPLWHRALPTQVSRDHMEPSQGSRTFSFVIQARDKGLQKVLSDASNHVSRLATSHPGWLPEMGGGVPDTSATAGVGVCHPFMQYTHAHSCSQTHTHSSHTAGPLSAGVHDKGVDGSLCPHPSCACAPDNMGDTTPPPQARETPVTARPDCPGTSRLHPPCAWASILWCWRLQQR